MIKTIIFDFFDVFRTDSYKAWLTANGFERTGVFSKASILMDQGKIDSDEFYRRISQAAGRDVTPEEVDDSASVNTAMIDFARILRQSYKSVLLSNGPGDFVRNLLDTYKLSDVFDVILISGETGLIKPHTEAFENALVLSESNAEESIFIDDNAGNTTSALALGIQSYVFTSVDQLKSDLMNAGIKF